MNRLVVSSKELFHALGELKLCNDDSQKAILLTIDLSASMLNASVGPDNLA